MSQDVVQKEVRFLHCHLVIVWSGSTKASPCTRFWAQEGDTTATQEIASSPRGPFVLLQFTRKFTEVFSLPGQLGFEYDKIIGHTKHPVIRHQHRAVQHRMDLDSRLSSKKTCPQKISVSIQLIPPKVSVFLYVFFYYSCIVLFQVAQAENTRVLDLRQLRPQITFRWPSLTCGRIADGWVDGKNGARCGLQTISEGALGAEADMV